VGEEGEITSQLGRQRGDEESLGDRWIRAVGKVMRTSVAGQPAEGDDVLLAQYALVRQNIADRHASALSVFHRAAENRVFL
jgi:hypothetical protein